jgi:hypothetical protein
MELWTLRRGCQRIGDLIEEVFLPVNRLLNEGFQVHAKWERDNICGYLVDTCTAHVYLGTEVIWHFSESGDRVHGYDGLEDFASYSLVRFSRRLADLLGTE